MAAELRLEALVGRMVLDSEGHRAGRIEEAIACRLNGEWVVSEFHLGPGALFERFALRHFGKRRSLCVPWDQLDLSDPEHPRLRCRLASLKAPASEAGPEAAAP